MGQTNKANPKDEEESVTPLYESFSKNIEYQLSRQRVQSMWLFTTVLLVVVSFATVFTYTVGKARQYDKLLVQIEKIGHETETVEMHISATRSDLRALREDIMQLHQSTAGMQRAITELLKASLKEGENK